MSFEENSPNKRDFARNGKKNLLREGSWGKERRGEGLPGERYRRALINSLGCKYGVGKKRKGSMKKVSLFSLRRGVR